MQQKGQGRVLQGFRPRDRKAILGPLRSLPPAHGATRRAYVYCRKRSKGIAKLSRIVIIRNNAYLPCLLALPITLMWHFSAT